MTAQPRLTLPDATGRVIAAEVRRFGRRGVETGGFLLAPEGQRAVTIVAFAGEMGIIRRRLFFQVSALALDQLFGFAGERACWVPGQFHSHATGAFLSFTDQEQGLRVQGFTSAVVHARPRVGVLSTGNELSRSSGPLAPGQIRDTNRPLLLALLRQSGFTAVDLGVAEDTHEAITRHLAEGVAQCDAVISTGGVSVGDVDHVKNVIGELGGDQARWMQVAIRPGKPFAFGVVGAARTPVFGLPGNPVSTRVSFELFVRPALRTLAGHGHVERLSVHAMLDVAVPPARDGRLHLVHVSARMLDDGLVHVRSAARPGSHLLHAVADANAIALVPEGVRSDVGDTLRVIVLDAEALSATT